MKMSELNIADWDEWYKRQASWTRDTRKFLLKKIKFNEVVKTLDVGCGTGALATEFDIKNWHGIDLDFQALGFAKKENQERKLANADALDLPFQDEKFGLVFAHYLLLWISDPIRIIFEMKRVTKSNGYVVFWGEPDHAGRLDFPKENAEIGTWQTRSLIQQGANVQIGRSLGSLLVSAGLSDVSFGVIGGMWSADQRADLLETKILKSDQSILSSETYPTKYLFGEGNFIYIPTFFGCGRKM